MFWHILSKHTRKSSLVGRENEHEAGQVMSYTRICKYFTREKFQDISKYSLADKIKYYA